MKKRMTSLLLVVLVCCMALAGCKAPAAAPKAEDKPAAAPAAAAENGGAIVNETYNADKMLTLNGTEVDLQAGYDDGTLAMYEPAGMGLTMPAVWKDIEGSLSFTAVSDTEIAFAFYSADFQQACIAAAEELNAMTPEEVSAWVTQYMTPVMGIFRVTDGNADAIRTNCDEKYTKREELARLGENIYYLAWNETYAAADLPKFSETDIAMLNSVGGTMGEVKQSIIIFPPQVVEKADYSDALTSFSTTDLDGSAVTQDIFSKYDLTMVNIWATWCGPCVAEMPDLATLHKNLTKNVNMISICIDGADDPETAKAILKDAGAGFIALVGNDELEENLLQHILAVPTTLFVASDGSIIGDAIEGALSTEEYQAEIDARLAEIS